MKTEPDMLETFQELLTRLEKFIVPLLQTPKNMEKKTSEVVPVTALINGKVTYDKYGGQYFWINDPNGGVQMLCEMRGWGHIQNMFKLPDGSIYGDAAAEFQDKVGDFIADAINEKIARLSQNKTP